MAPQALQFLQPCSGYEGRNARLRAAALSFSLALIVALFARFASAQDAPAPAAANKPAEPVASDAGTPEPAQSSEPAPGDDLAPPPTAAQPAREPADTNKGPTVPETICEGKRISRIVIKGEGRVAADDIRSTIKLREGLPCTDGEVTRDAQALWDLGYFRDVKVQGDVAGDEIVLDVRGHRAARGRRAHLPGQRRHRDQRHRGQGHAQDRRHLIGSGDQDPGRQDPRPIRRERLLPRQGPLRAPRPPEQRSASGVRD